MWREITVRYKAKENTFYCKDEDTVLDLKVKIYHCDKLKTILPPIKQSLKYQGEELEDDKGLHWYNIKSHLWLNVTRK
jgi:hypothetical protein